MDYRSVTSSHKSSQTCHKSQPPWHKRTQQPCHLSGVWLHATTTRRRTVAVSHGAWRCLSVRPRIVRCIGKSRAAPGATTKNRHKHVRWYDIPCGCNTMARYDENISDRNAAQAHLPMFAPRLRRHRATRSAKDGTNFSLLGYCLHTLAMRRLKVLKESDLFSVLRSLSSAHAHTFS